MRARVIAAGLLVLSACTAHVTPRSSATPSGSTPVHPISGLAACPATEAFSRLRVFARVQGADDLLALGDGTVWVSDPGHGMLHHLAADGRVLETIADPDTPEGIASLPDGRLAVAEQRLNRIITLRPPSVARTLLFELPSAGTAAGVDGIAFDARASRLLVPDSPHGTLVEWPLPDGPARTVARGLGRAVGAAVGSDGTVYVTAEAAPGLMRIVGSGGEQVGALIQADDVVADGGLLYATLIGNGALVAVDPSSGAHRVLVKGIGSAQGLAVMRDGRLAVADSNRGTVAIARACG